MGEFNMANYAYTLGAFEAARHMFEAAAIVDYTEHEHLALASDITALANDELDGSTYDAAGELETRIGGLHSRWR